MPSRIRDLTSGTAMVVTDLHGDRDAFDRYIARFRQLHQAGHAQRLVLLGDLIHGRDQHPALDQSVSMVLDTIALQDEFGADTVMMLLGNHEMPHLYGVQLVRGDDEFTARFEHALGPFRDQVRGFFDRLPLYIRTAAGVMLSHAGPSLAVLGKYDVLCDFDHHAILKEADDVLAQAENLSELYDAYAHMLGRPYDEMARHYLAIQGRNDPRYPELLRAFMISHQSAQFDILWNALFTQNESGLTEQAYLNGCQEFLRQFSAGAPVPQRVIVSGHIVTPSGGYTLPNRYHLRVSSATHARPRESGCYLLLDCARPVESAIPLTVHLHSVFDAD